jgi:hypothetical protein
MRLLIASGLTILPFSAADAQEESGGCGTIYDFRWDHETGPDTYHHSSTDYTGGGIEITGTYSNREHASGIFGNGLMDSHFFLGSPYHGECN